MVDQLEIQYDLLDQLADDLKLIAREYANADEFSDDVADAVGHERLAERVREFSTKWNDRRKNMLEQVEALQGQVEAIRDAFAQVDDELLKALTEGADNAPPPHPSNMPI